MGIKVLVVGLYGGMGGVQTYLMNLLKNIDSDIIKFDYIVPGENTLYEKKIIEQGGEVFYITPKKLNVIKNLFENFRLLKDNRNEYDIVYFNHSLLYYIFPFLFAKIFNYPLILSHAHSAGPLNPPKSLRYRLHKFNKKIIVKYSHYLLSCSNEATNWVFGDNNTLSKNVKIIPNGIDTKMFDFNMVKRSEFRSRYNINDETVVLGIVARLSEEKNHEFLIKVFEDFNKINNKSKLIIIGDGPLREHLKNIVESKDIKDSVVFLGSQTNISDFLQMMDVFVLPSKYEGLGISLIEAQSTGLLCITSKDRVPENVNITGNVKFLDLDQNSSKEWANRINEEYKNFVREDKSIVVSNAGYDIKKVARNFEEYIKQITLERGEENV